MTDVAFYLMEKPDHTRGLMFSNGVDGPPFVIFEENGDERPRAQFFKKNITEAGLRLDELIINMGETLDKAIEEKAIPDERGEKLARRVLSLLTLAMLGSLLSVLEKKLTPKVPPEELN
jgi:hypothetical protein